MERILIINGPNLNLLGTRQPDVYGSLTMESCLASLREAYPDVTIDYYQSNVEGFIIDRLHAEALSALPPRAIVLNAGAYTHTSLAIADAIEAVPSPVVEVHLSNIFAREEIRRRSLIAPVCAGSISGFGAESYALAIQAIIDMCHEG